MTQDTHYSSVGTRKAKQTKSERNKMKIKTLEAKPDACEIHLCKTFGPLMAVMVTFACLSSAQAVDSSSGDPKETAIRELSVRMAEAYNRGDASGVAANFTPDGHLISGDGTHLHTPAGIEHYLAELQTKLPKGTRFVITAVTDVRFPTPDVAVVTSEDGWLFPGETTSAEKNKGIQSLVAVWREGTWRVVLVERTWRCPPQRLPGSQPN
jgi:uncharacterized protein (TIGR02246 family)